MATMQRGQCCFLVLHASLGLWAEVIEAEGSLSLVLPMTCDMLVTCDLFT
jgi:hypothetical protein